MYLSGYSTTHKELSRDLCPPQPSATISDSTPSCRRAARGGHCLRPGRPSQHRVSRTARGGQRADYQAAYAQQRARQRRAASAANHPTKPATLWHEVRRLLRQRWSPEQIAGRRVREGAHADRAVSYQAIYDWLTRTGSALLTRLRHYRAFAPWRPSSGGLPKSRPSIRQRPRDVLQRHTLTLDNGSEFARYETITHALGTRIFFADPGRPGQRARNENITVKVTMSMA